MSGVFKSLSGVLSGTSKVASFSGVFKYAETLENISSGIHIATFSHGEWLMVENKGIVITSYDDLPGKRAVNLFKKGRWWKVLCDDKTEITMPQTYIKEETHYNEVVHVAMVPSLYDIRYRSISTRVVALLGKADSGAVMLIGVNPKRVGDFPKVDQVQLKSLWYGVDAEKASSMPGWSGPGVQHPDPEILNLAQAKAVWFSNYVLPPSNFTEEDFDVETEIYWHALWKRILGLGDTQTVIQITYGQTEEPSDDETGIEDDPRAKDFITDVKPPKFGDKKLSRSGGTEQAGGKEAFQVKLKDLNGRELPKKEMEKKKLKMVSLNKLPSSEALSKKKPEPPSIYDIMLQERRASQ